MGLADPRGASATPSTRAAAQAEAALRLAPPWTALADGLATGEASHFGDAARGWQQAAWISGPLRGRGFASVLVAGSLRS